MNALRHMELAPWIQKATTLIEHHRKVGGNQFRHCLATMTILIDYHFIDSILLKAAIVHDLLEDSDKVTPAELAAIDEEGPEVLKIVEELTRDKEKTSKQDYLEKLLREGSVEARIVKLADRISNLTDLHLFVFRKNSALLYIEQTERYILPMVQALLDEPLSETRKNMITGMGKELHDLIVIRRMYVEEFSKIESIRMKIRNKLKSIKFRIL